MEEIRSFKWSLILVTFTYIIFIIPGYLPEASSRIILEEGKEEYPLGAVFELLEDKDNKWNITDVSSNSISEQFFHFDGNIPSYGYSSSAYWVRMTFENHSDIDEWLLEIAYPPHDHISLYTPSEEDGYFVNTTGDLLPFSTREIQHRNFVFELSIPPSELKTYYLHIKSDGSMQLPITLWKEKEFHQKSLLEYILLGLYYGFGLIMIIYNLFLFASLRLSSYLWYVLFIFSIMLVHFSLNGLSFQYLWPEMPWWNHRAILFFMACTSISALLFTKSFLNTKVYTPAIDKLFNCIIFTQPALIGILFISYEFALNLIMATTLSIVIIVITAAVRSYKKGYIPARYFLFAWVIFLVGVLISSLADMAIIPITFMTKYASQLGSSAEIILFSLALAEKIKLLRLEKEAAVLQAKKSQELAVRHLQQANQVKDEFLANTSHELRTPLHGIIGIAESLQAGGEVDDHVKKNLSLIISSGKRLSTLIDDLLDASKLKHHELDLEINPVPLNDLAEVVCSISTSLVIGKPVIIRNQIPDNIPRVAADENRLQQIFYNLIGNAVKNTDIGEIILSAEKMEQNIIVSITDTGKGISEADLEKVFLSFERGSYTSARGTGLGLSITKQLVELHGGEIAIHSKIGKGTTVSFSVPIYKDIEKTSKQILMNPLEYFPLDELESFEPTIHNNSDGKYLGKILIADDESINVQVLLNHLTMAGYEVVVVYDGEKVLEKLESERSIDLVILDVMLPKLSGFDVTRKLRDKFTLTDLPILMLTARSQIEDIVTALEMGANDYLTKPCSKEELLARVKTLLSLKTAVEKVTTINNELQDLNLSLEHQVNKRTEEIEMKSEQLRRMEQARRKLMSNISHELGTPMTSIRGYLKAMIDGVVEANDQKYLLVVYQKVLVIDRLIQDLYELSRLEARKVSFKWHNYTLSEIIPTLFTKYEMDVKAHHIDFQINYDLQEDDLQLEVTIDIDRIDQVLHNLIFNAIRYTDPSGLITIEISKRDSQNDAKNGSIVSFSPQIDSYLQVSVRDNGKGISADTIPHIFERFYQEESSRTKHGKNIGLGLSISKEIIEYHQGHIWAKSELGKGTTFHFILPINKDNHLI